MRIKLAEELETPRGALDPAVDRALDALREAGAVRSLAP